MYNIFLVEDSHDIISFFTNAIPSEAELHIATTVQEAEKILESKQNFDLIFIDLSLPDGSGYSICSNLSMDNRFQDTPVFIVTADDSADSKVLGFKLNIDSYLTKPLNTKVLKSLIENRLYKKTHQKKRKLTTDFFSLDLFSNHLKSGDNSIELTPIESRLLQIFIQHEGQILSREQLIDMVWGNDTSITDRVVDQYISSLRKKLNFSNMKFIKTVYGMGYQASFKSAA